MQQPSKIWYACYGSNILEERFLCYICGGTPAGAFKNFEGCRDKSKPEASGKIQIPYELYFAKKSVTWNGGGIGFLKPAKDNSRLSLGRKYLISADQFSELVQQELLSEEEVEIDFSELERIKRYDCKPKGRYSRLLYLGEENGIPIISFTSEFYLEDQINAPNPAYLTTIIRGLREIYKMTDNELYSYFKDIEGIKNTPLRKELPEIIRSAV